MKTFHVDLEVTEEAARESIPELRRIDVTGMPDRTIALLGRLRVALARGLEFLAASRAVKEKEAEPRVPVAVRRGWTQP